MKKLTMLMLLALAAAVSAADGRFDIKKIRCFSRSTPIPRYENDDSSSKTAKKNQWLCLETIFIPESMSSTAKAEQWYDDITMEGTVVLARPAGKGISYIVLTGKTRFFTIQADAKQHIGMFYVPSKILARYLGTWNGEPPIEMAKVAFYAPGRILLGEGYWAQGSGKKGKFVPVTGKDYRAVAERMKKYEKNTTLRGGLYSKEKTPWVYYEYGKYENDLIYDNVLQQDSGNIKQ